MKVYMNLESEPTTAVKVLIEGMILRLFFDFEQQATEASADDDTSEVGDSLYSCENVDIEGGDRSYGGIVSAIINEKYPQSNMDAVRLNYDLAKDDTSSITDEKRAEYISEYNAMQEWRTHAKEIASAAVAMINE